MKYYKILTNPNSLKKYQHCDIFFYTDGKYIKYKNRNATLTSEQLSKEYEDNLYITMYDRINTIRNKQRALNKELTQSITVDVIKARVALKKIIENMLDEPRTLVLIEAKNTINIIVNEFLTDPNIVVKLTEVALHDYSTSLHITNCMLLSMGYAYFHNLGTYEIKKMGLIGLMHDVGKVDIPDYILQAARKLTDEEFDMIKGHPKHSRDLLIAAEGFEKDVIYSSYQHHERIDGSGYPNGITGDAINEYAKILSIIDVYEALTHWRPYKNAMTPIEALTIIKNDVDAGKLSKEYFIKFTQSIVSI